MGLLLCWMRRFWQLNHLQTIHVRGYVHLHPDPVSHDSNGYLCKGEYSIRVLVYTTGISTRDEGYRLWSRNTWWSDEINTGVKSEPELGEILPSAEKTMIIPIRFATYVLDMRYFILA